MGNNLHLKRFPGVGFIACDFQSHRANAKVGYLSRVNQNAAFSKKGKTLVPRRKRFRKGWRIQKVAYMTPDRGVHVRMYRNEGNCDLHCSTEVFTLRNSRGHRGRERCLCHRLWVQFLPIGTPREVFQKPGERSIS